MFGLHDCDYKCNDCSHVWRDAKQKGYEEMAYEISGCPECGSKDCKWRTHESEPMTEERKAALYKKMHRPGGQLGKPPKEFVDGVLKRIDENHKTRASKTSINLDW